MCNIWKRQELIEYCFLTDIIFNETHPTDRPMALKLFLFFMDPKRRANGVVNP